MIAAILSAVCLAAMVILDQLMMKDTYDNSPSQAIIISSVGGSTLGLTSTAAWWLMQPEPIMWYVHNVFTWAYPFGLLIALAGVLSSQVLHQYFVCFSKNADGNVVASWLAATPVFVYVTVIVLDTLGLLQTGALYSSSTVLGVLLATAGLFLLERVSNPRQFGPGNYWPNLVMFLVLNVIYIILIDWTLTTGAEILGVTTTTLTLSLLPWYWFGFLYGARTALQKRHREKFRVNLQTIKRYIAPIIVVEIIGMYVFFFEFVGLSELNPVSVALVTGLHAILVWVTSVLLGVYAHKLKQREQNSVTLGTIKVSFTAIQQFQQPTNVRVKQAACVVTVLAGVFLFF